MDLRKVGEGGAKNIILFSCLTLFFSDLFKLIIKTFIMYTNIPDSLLGPCIGEWSLWKTDGENL